MVAATLGSLTAPLHFIRLPKLL